MPSSRLPYREGTWFAVPLETGSFALGLVARCSKEGKVLFGYFFGPKRSSLPTVNDCKSQKASNAILVCQFGDLGLMNGTWPVLGNSSSWDRSQWPMPQFVRTDSISGKLLLITYDENDPVEEIKMERVEKLPPVHLPKDGLSGYRAVEIKLSMLL